MSAKTDLLALLEQNRGETLSGEALAGRLGVSRAAVWKAVDALRREGYAIEAQKGSGYRLAPGSDKLSEEGLRAWMDGVGFPLRVLEETTSTNTEAKHWAAENAGHGALVVAERQVGGKGRLGRSFASPPGGLYMSLVLRPRAGQAGVMRLTAAAAVAVCRVVQRLCGLSLGVKWVNDLFYEGRKCCGILTEGVAGLEAGGFEYLVVGIGLNVNTPAEAFGKELSGVATSLFPAGDAPVPRARLAVEIRRELLALFDTLEAGAFLEEYRARSVVLGKRVTVLANPPYEARAFAIDEEARLWVRRDDGQEAALAAGEISVKL